MLAEALLRCPVGCNFLWTIERDSAPLAEALAPEQAYERATVALDALNPWSDTAVLEREVAIERGTRLDGLAREVAAHPASQWWLDPCDTSRQMLPTYCSSYRQPERPGEPTHIKWEDYAQRPASGHTTSTLYGDVTSIDVAIDRRLVDWERADQRSRAIVDQGASVFEITGPADWHALCAAWPRVNKKRNGPAGKGTLVPDWRRVAEEYDGVHLTFAGLLTTPFVRETSAAGTTMLWSWDVEHTTWLRDVVRPGASLQPLDSERPGRIDHIMRHPKSPGLVFTWDPSGQVSVNAKGRLRWSSLVRWLRRRGFIRARK